MAKVKVLWDGSCKHHGFINAFDWNEDGNHYLATVKGGLEKGQYLNSTFLVSKYAAKRYEIGRFWFNIGHVSGYHATPIWFMRFGYTGNEYEYSIVPNIFNFTAITMKTRWRYVDEIYDDQPHNIVDWIKQKVKS